MRRPAGWLMSRNSGSVGGFDGPRFTVLPDVEVVTGVGVVAADDAACVPV